jgi:predicted nucleotidyltransferase
MADGYPTVAQLLGALVAHGYRVEIYLQGNEKYAVVATRKDQPRMGVSIESLTTRMLTAALIKIKRKIEAE